MFFFANFVNHMIDFCQNKAMSNKVILLNLSVTSPVIRRIPMFEVEARSIAGLIDAVEKVMPR